MGIQNTEKLTEERCDLMNVGLRTYNLSVADKNDLTDWFGLGYRTISRWFATQGQQYRRCVPAYTWETPPVPGADPGLRIYRMFDPTNPSGTGKPLAPAKGGSLLNHLRGRCVMAATMGVEGGLIRIPIFTGSHVALNVQKATLKEALSYINTLYTGNHKVFIAQAWVSMVLEPNIVEPFGWTVIVTYANKVPGVDVFYDEEQEYDDEEEEEEDPDQEEETWDGAP